MSTNVSFGQNHSWSAHQKTNSPPSSPVLRKVPPNASAEPRAARLKIAQHNVLGKAHRTTNTPLCRRHARSIAERSRKMHFVVVVAPTCGLRSRLRQRGMGCRATPTQDFILGYFHGVPLPALVLGSGRAHCPLADVTCFPGVSISSSKVPIRSPFTSCRTKLRR